MMMMIYLHVYESPVSTLLDLVPTPPSAPSSPYPSLPPYPTSAPVYLNSSLPHCPTSTPSLHHHPSPSSHMPKPFQSPLGQLVFYTIHSHICSHIFVSHSVSPCHSTHHSQHLHFCHAEILFLTPQLHH